MSRASPALPCLMLGQFWWCSWLIDCRSASCNSNKHNNTVLCLLYLCLWVWWWVSVMSELWVVHMRYVGVIHTYNARCSCLEYSRNTRTHTPKHTPSQRSYVHAHTQAPKILTFLDPLLILALDFASSSFTGTPKFSLCGRIDTAWIFPCNTGWQRHRAIVEEVHI